MLRYSKQAAITPLVKVPLESLPLEPFLIDIE